MKIILCDMSGIASNRGENNVVLLKTMQNLKNYECSFCTGKGYRGVNETLNGFDFRFPIICENGSVIVSRDGSVLYNDSMDFNKVSKLIYTITELPFEFLAYVDLKTHKYKFLRGSKELSESLSQPWFFSEEIYNDTGLFLKNIDKDNICRITTRGLVLDRIPDILNEFHVVVSENEFHSICNKGINKGSGVKKLAEICNIDMKDIIVIGNDKNDIDMFLMEGCYKIATGTVMPPKKLLELADTYVTIDELPAFIEKIDTNGKT